MIECDINFVLKLIILASKDTSLKYELPEGRIIEIGAERLLATEILFDPSLDRNYSEIEDLSIGSIYMDCINSTHVSLRKDLKKNILFTGGNSCIKEIYARLEREFQMRSDKKYYWIQTRKIDSTSYFSNLPPNLIQKIENSTNITKNKFNLLKFEEYQANSIWVGASILSCLSTFQQCWITRDQYLEGGEEYIAQKSNLYYPKII